MSFYKAPLLSGLLEAIAVIVVACVGSEPTPEEEYFEQVRAARALTTSKFEAFDEIFGQAWPLRERLIGALLEAGVGTAFTGTLEALEGTNPPEGFQAAQQSLVEATRELARLDAEAAQAVEDEGLAWFVLIHGQLGDVNGSFMIDLPGGFCNALNPMEPPLQSLCAPVEELPGGEYGARLNQMLRQFQPRFESAGGVFAFPLSLLPEELAQVYSVEVPIVEKLLQEIRDGVGGLAPHRSSGLTMRYLSNTWMDSHSPSTR